MKSFQILSFLFFVALVGLTSCKKDATDDPSGADGTLFALINNNQFAYYKGNNAILQPAGTSPHGPFKLRFNAKALSALDSTGKLPKGASFPDSSIVLKEVFDGENLKQLVPMMKMQNDKNAVSGWIWAQYDAKGKILYSATKQGGKCVSCHSANGHRDYTISFDLH
jgi:Cytochrome P460